MKAGGVRECQQCWQEERAEEMAPGQDSRLCGMSLLDTWHKVVKVKPRAAAAARGLRNRSVLEFIFCATEEGFSFSWDSVWKLFYPLDSQRL